MSTWLHVPLVFLTTAGLVALLLYLAPWQALRIKRRLREVSRPSAGGRLRRGPQDPFPTVTRMLERRGYLDPITGLLAQAGTDLRASEFVVLDIVCAVVPALAVWLFTRSALMTLPVVLLGAALPVLGLRVAQERRLKKFDEQLPDGLMLIASSLRSGYGFMRAVQVLSQEMAPPIASEFKKTIEEVNLGIETEEALRHMTERVKSYDLEITVSAVCVQLQVGGNLAQLLETIAETIRERHRIRAEVTTLTAEARMSGTILFLLPPIMLLIVSLLNPGYIGPLTRTQFGHMLIAGALVLQVVGGLVIRRMVQLEL